MRPAAAGTSPHKPEALDEIVDEGQVIERLPAAEHREAPAREAAEHLQEARVARAVDADRPRDDDVEAVGAPNSRASCLGFELGLLIDVAGIERRIFVGRRIRDVAVHAAGAAVHDAPDAAPPARASSTFRVPSTLMARYAESGCPASR